MRTLSRAYQPGDEAQINRLYLSLTGRDRTPAEFAWEWLDTWAGRGSMNLLFDLDREEGDQLVAQYSLIPTPLSVLGHVMLAGKTENCMSHPDVRGTGLYSAHERECFEREKERYSFFFTTAGQVAGGAVRRVRTKLGYVAFDDWANYTLWLDEGALHEDVLSILTSRRAGLRRAAPALSVLLTGLMRRYGVVRRPRSCRHRVVARRPEDAPLDEIAGLWDRNRRLYGVSVERNVAYLRWRVNEDPHVDHEYLVMRGDDGLLGYAVTFVQGDDLHLVDIIVDGARKDLFACLLAALVERGRELGCARIKCLTLRRSALLPGRLRSAGFVDASSLAPHTLFRKPPPRQFLVYIPDALRGEEEITDNAAWYITALVMEGLPRT